MLEALRAEKNVLIVEDKQFLADALRDKFVKAGYAVSIASNGEEGLATALATHPHILLVDLIMPKMGGMEMMTLIRKDSWGKHVPAIILTDLSADSGDLVRGVVEVQPMYYLVKSDWDLGEIVDKVTTILKERGGDAA